jgi:LmbE family N-acetylglucosaminyl deacetylase
MKKICIVSPHLDDAILSCGILMQRHAGAGEVLVLNIFSAGTNSDNRKKEDAAAQKKIGARPFYLDELDAPDRNPVYKPSKELFFASLEREGDAIARVAQRVSAFLAEHKIDLAYFPLGAGTHIDHRITFEVGKHLKGTPVRFYEDRPYILWPGILQARMNQIGVDAGLPPVTAAMMRASVNTCHYLKSFVPDDGNYRAETLPLYAAPLQQKPAHPLFAASEVLTATDAELKKLYASLSLYTSQMPLIYRDYDNFVADSLAYERATSGTGAYVERSWAIKF